MIDINELRDRAATFGSDYLTDEEWVAVIDRLEAAEKERDELRAKVDAMERHEPVLWANSSNINSSRINKERGGHGDCHTCSETQTAYHDTPLYALPGAQPAPSVPDDIVREVLRDCCGTFHGSRHRITCEKYKGKKAPEAKP